MLWTNRSQIIYSKIVATPTTTYIVGLSKSFASYTLHVTALSTTSGELLASNNIPSSITDGPSSLLSLSPTTSASAPQVVWLESGSIKSVVLTEKLDSKPTTVKGASYEKIVDVGLTEKGYFVALKEGDGTARVVKLAEGEKDGLKIVWEFADSVSFFEQLSSTSIRRAADLLFVDMDDDRRSLRRMRSQRMLEDWMGRVCRTSGGYSGRTL